MVCVVRLANSDSCSFLVHQAQGCLALIDLAGTPAARTAMLCTAVVYAHCVQRYCPVHDRDFLL